MPEPVLIGYLQYPEQCQGYDIVAADRCGVKTRRIYGSAAGPIFLCKLHTEQSLHIVSKEEKDAANTGG